ERISQETQILKLDTPRVTVVGKFLYRDNEKLYVKGITYGPFAPQPDGSVYGTPQVVDRDFAQIAAAGINCVRVYSIPPRWLMDLARKHGLLVMVGIAWWQYVAFFDDPALVKDCFDQVDMAVQ